MVHIPPNPDQRQSKIWMMIGVIPTVKKIPDELWDEIRLILPPEKPDNTIGRPAVSFRKILDGIVYVLRTGCQWKMLPKEYGFGSTCHR